MNYKQKMIKKFEKQVDKELEKIADIENKDEKICKLEVLYNFHQVLSNYEELEPLFKEFFRDKAIKDKWKGDER